MPPAAPAPNTRRRWPASAWGRVGVQLLLAAPLIALAWWATHRGYVSEPHREAMAAAAATAAGGSDLGGLGAAYPPGPVVLALIVPGGAFGLCVVSSLAAAFMLHTLIEHLLGRGMSLRATLAVLAPLYATPAVALLASQSVTGIATLALLTTAVVGYLRFARERSTEGGFVAGLALAGAFLYSPIALFYAAALGIATVSVARERYRREPAAVPATVGVVLFPVAFMLLAWMFMEWRFAGSVFATMQGDPRILAFPGGPWPSLLAAAATVGISLLHAPLYLAAGAALLVRERSALLAYVIPIAGSIIAVWTGLLFTQVTGTVLFTVLALVAIPHRPSRRLLVAVVVIALAQAALGWVWPPTSPGFVEWWHLIRP